MTFTLLDVDAIPDATRSENRDILEAFIATGKRHQRLAFDPPLTSKQLWHRAGNLKRTAERHHLPVATCVRDGVIYLSRTDEPGRPVGHIEVGELPERPYDPRVDGVIGPLPPAQPADGFPCPHCDKALPTENGRRIHLAKIHGVRGTSKAAKRVAKQRAAIDAKGATSSPPPVPATPTQERAPQRPEGSTATASPPPERPRPDPPAGAEGTGAAFDRKAKCAKSGTCRFWHRRSVLCVAPRPCIGGSEYSALTRQDLTVSGKTGEV